MADEERDDDPVELDPYVGPRGRPDAIAQAKRNIKIVGERARGVPVDKIAERHGITRRRAEQIIRKYRESNPTLRVKDPVDIVDELLNGYQATIEDLAEVAASDDVHPNAKVGAHNAKMRAYREMAELLQATGVLPHDLGTFNLVIDGRITAERIITVLERFNVSEEVYDAMLEAISPQLAPGDDG